MIKLAGSGLVCPLGLNVDSVLDAIFSKKSTFREIDRFELGESSPKIGGQLSSTFEDQLSALYDFDDLLMSMIVKAAEDALGDYQSNKLGLVLASNFSLMETLEWSWRERIDHDEIDLESFQSQQNIIKNICDHLNIKGPSAQLSLSCASGLSAVSLAEKWLLAKRCESVLVISYDILSEFIWCGLSNLRTITSDSIKPFDQNRSGTIFSEGVAAVLLSTDEQLSADHYLIAAETNNNAYHLTAPSKRAAGSSTLINRLFESSGIDKASIDLIAAHGTSTKANDKTESEAFNDLFSHEPAVIALKSYLGHMLGAAGLAELIITEKLMHLGKCPEINGLVDLDPECETLNLSRQNCDKKIDTALINSAGIGGNNAAAIISNIASKKTIEYNQNPLYLHNTSWVLPGETGSGQLCIDPEELLDKCQISELINPQDYLKNVRGYLDPASKCVLVAGSMCIKDINLTPSRTAIITLTSFGAQQSAYNFYEAMIKKGHRFASPMIFPHSYSNTAANLFAIENSFDGPHYVFDKAGDIIEGFELSRILINSKIVDDVILILYESTIESALPNDFEVLNGAIAYHFNKNPGKVFGIQGMETSKGAIYASLKVNHFKAE